MSCCHDCCIVIHTCCTEGDKICPEHHYYCLCEQDHDHRERKVDQLVDIQGHQGHGKEQVQGCVADRINLKHPQLFASRIRNVANQRAAEKKSDIVREIQACQRQELGDIGSDECCEEHEQHAVKKGLFVKRMLCLHFF